MIIVAVRGSDTDSTMSLGYCGSITDVSRRSSYIGIPSRSVASGLLVLEYQESSSIGLL
jgi:hypothetical protein